MQRLKTIPCALTVAGSDSGGGAGLQADLKTFAALGLHGVSVITCITAQNPRTVVAVQPCSAVMVQRQLEAVSAELCPAAAKTGMVYSSSIIRTVAAFFRGHPLPLVVDPVAVSTSGTRLLRQSALAILCRELLPVAALVTPNLPEAELLVGESLATVEDLRRAAKRIHQSFGCAVLVKGGHLRGLKEAVDIFYDGREEVLLSAPMVRGIRTHGTGCTYSAAITAYLARGSTLLGAVTKAKEFITQAIAHSQATAGHPVLDSLWRCRGR